MGVVIENAAFAPPNEKSVVKPYVMSHGTCECYDMKETRRFYEEFLGLQCVRHAKPAMVFRCGLKFHVVCVEVGDKVHPCSVLNHWGVDVLSREDVDRAHALAHEHKDLYGIKKIMPVTDQHGAYSFYLEDLDGNWWEIQHVPDGFHDVKFAAGDIAAPDREAGRREVEDIARAAGQARRAEP